MRVQFTALLAALALPLAGVEAQDGFNVEIRVAVQQYIDATNSGDPQRLADLYLEDPTTGSLGDGRIYRSWNTISDLIHGIYGQAGAVRLAVSDLTVTRLGEDAALVYFDAAWSVGDMQVTSYRGAMTIVFVRNNGAWRVAHDHTSTLEGSVQQVTAEGVIGASGVGPVSLDMSEADLVRALGSRAVEPHHFYVAEGVCTPGSRVFPGSAAEIEVSWQDTTYSDISSLSIRQPASPWRTRSGVGMGSTLKELERISGAPISFSGFDWDYGGWATWTEEETRLALRLAPAETSDRTVYDHPRFSEILGERTVSSDHPVVRRMTIVVSAIYLSGPATDGVHYECPRG